jgi:predicted anti-sigma-YlaC factor YlaD
MVGDHAHDRCDRARAGASAALDGELSHLEHVWVRAHIAACPDCRAFVATARGATALLRQSPLVRAGFASAWDSAPARSRLAWARASRS